MSVDVGSKRLWQSWLGGALLFAAACSAIVDPGKFQVRCEVSSQGVDPCGPNMVCTGGVCQQRRNGSHGSTPVAAGELGASCASDVDCHSGFCIATSALGLGNSSGTSVCGTACCRDADCPEGSVCFQAGSGARACLPSDLAGRQHGELGSNCSSASQCASGVCQKGLCTATCIREADCVGETCRLSVTSSSVLRGAGAFVCGSATGRGDSGALCSPFDPTSCKSGLCVGTACAPPCGSNADCASGRVCSYVGLPGLLGQGRVSACVDASQNEPSPGPTCCTDADCGGYACKAMQNNKAFGMYCSQAAAPQ